MYSVTKEFRFEAAHRLLDYPGACGYLHGHSYIVQVTAASYTLDTCGFVMDFKDLKSAIRSVIGSWDHSTILQETDPLAPVLKSLDQKIITFEEQPTAEHMAKKIFHELVKLKVPVLRVRVYETADNFAEVQYEQ